MSNWWIYGIIIILAGTFTFIFNFWWPSSGSHTGYITASETNWFLWYTKAAYFKTQTESSQEDTYCVVDQNLFNQMQEYQNKQQRVTITFANGLFVPKWECGSGLSIITSVVPT